MLLGLACCGGWLARCGTLYECCKRCPFVHCLSTLPPALQAGAQLLRALAALWAVPEEAVQQYVALHKPAVQAGAADLAVGRATLPLLDAAAGRQALAVAGGKVGGGGLLVGRGPLRICGMVHHA